MTNKEKYLQAVAYNEQKQYDKALELFRQLNDDADNIDDFYFIRGALNFNCSEIDDAIVDFEKALAQDPAHAQAAMLLGNIYFNEQNYTKAIEIYSRAIFYKENYYEAIYQRLLSRLHIKDAQGLVIDREAAQADADRLLAYKDKVFNFSKEGKKLHLDAIVIKPDGEIDFRVTPE